MSAVRANGYMQIPAQKEGVEGGDCGRPADRSADGGGGGGANHREPRPSLDYLADLVRPRGVDLPPPTSGAWAA